MAAAGLAPVDARAGRTAAATGVAVAAGFSAGRSIAHPVRRAPARAPTATSVRRRGISSIRIMVTPLRSFTLRMFHDRGFHFDNAVAGPDVPGDHARAIVPR